MKFTVRQLLVFVSCAAIAFAALRLGGVFASIVILSLCIVTLGATIIAFVGHNQPKIYAIGYVITVVLYGVVHLAFGSNELDPFAGRLPTTRVIGPLFEAMANGKYIDNETGKEIPDFDPTEDPTRSIVLGGGGLGSGIGGGGSVVRYVEVVDRSTFMTLAHILFATLLGCLGGIFAVYVHDGSEQ